MDALVTKCHNCDFADPELVAVRRVYVTPQSWDTEPSVRTSAEVEWWCVSCTTQYPNDPVTTDITPHHKSNHGPAKTEENSGKFGSELRTQPVQHRNSS